MQPSLSRGAPFVAVAPFYAEAVTSVFSVGGFDSGASVARLPLMGALAKMATESFLLGSAPLLTDSASTGGAYFLRTPDGLCLGVIKPQDEEPYSVNNPKGHLPESSPDAGTDAMEGRDGCLGVGATDTDEDEEDEDSTLNGALSRNAAVRSEAASLHRRLPGLPEAGRNMMRRGVRPGDGVIREAAAFLLDHGGHAAVPPTTLILARHSALYASSIFRRAYISAANYLQGGGEESVGGGAAPLLVADAAAAALFAGLGADFLETIAIPETGANAETDVCGRCGGNRSPSVKASARGGGGCGPLVLPALTASARMWPPVKHCSFQAFVPHACSAEAVSSNVWPVEEVHKIAINDIRLTNTDRNTDNILCRAWLAGDAALADLRTAEAHAVAEGAHIPTPSLVRYWKDTLASRGAMSESTTTVAEVTQLLVAPASSLNNAVTTGSPPRASLNPLNTFSAVALSNNASGSCAGGSGETTFKLSPTSSPLGRPPRAIMGSPRGIAGGIAVAGVTSLRTKEILSFAPFDAAGINLSSGLQPGPSFSGLHVITTDSDTTTTILGPSCWPSPSHSPSRLAFTSYVPPHRRSALLTGITAASAPLTSTLSLDGAPASSTTPSLPSSSSLPSVATKDMAVPVGLSFSRHLSFRSDEKEASPLAIPPTLSISMGSLSLDNAWGGIEAVPSSPTALNFLSSAREPSHPRAETTTDDACANSEADPLGACEARSSPAFFPVVLDAAVITQRSLSPPVIASASSSSFSSPALHPLTGGDGSLPSSHDDYGIKVRELRSAERIELVPIDHGLCLPSASHLQDISFCWTSWKQCDSPLSPDSVSFVASLDGRRDALLLWSVFGGPSMRKDSVLTLRLSTALLQDGVRAGLSLSEIGRMMCRLDGLGRIAASDAGYAAAGTAANTEALDGGGIDEAEIRRRAKTKKKRIDRAKVKARQRERARARLMSESGESVTGGGQSDDFEIDQLPSAFEQCVRKARATWRSARKRITSESLIAVAPEGSAAASLKDIRWSSPTPTPPPRSQTESPTHSPSSLGAGSPTQSRSATRSGSVSDAHLELLVPLMARTAKYHRAQSLDFKGCTAGATGATAKKSWNVVSKAARARAASRRTASNESLDNAGSLPGSGAPQPGPPTLRTFSISHECVCKIHGQEPYFFEEHDAITVAFRAHLVSHLAVVVRSRRG